MVARRAREQAHLIEFIGRRMTSSLLHAAIDHSLGGPLRSLSAVSRLPACWVWASLAP